METAIRVNGKETGRFHTNEMIFGVVPFIVELTKYFTLWPGDVIWMGSDGASPDIKAGDVVEIESPARHPAQPIRGREAKAWAVPQPRIISWKAWSISASNIFSPISAPTMCR